MLDFAEFRYTLEKMGALTGLTFSEAEARQMFEKVDVNADGVIQLEECSLRSEVLAALLRAQPLSAISIRRCHSLQGEAREALPATCGALRALACAGLSCAQLCGVGDS